MDNASWLEPSNSQGAVDLPNTSGAEPHGTWMNPRLSSPPLVPAIPSQIGTCGYAQVDGRESYIDAGNPDLGLTNQVTVMAWIRWDIDPATGNPGASLVSLGSDSWRDDGQFWLQHHRWRNRFTFVVRTDRGKRRLTAPRLYQPVPGRWYHLAGVYDGQWMKLYVDGQLVRQRKHQGNFKHQDTYQLLAGRRLYRWWNYRWSSRYFHGSIDEIRIYKQALSGTEVQQAMHTRRDCAPEFADYQPSSPEPVMALHMDEAAWNGVAGEVVDSSDNAFHGVAVNGATTGRDEPALPGDPGTHAYGEFDGQSQYLDMGSPDLDLHHQVTVMAWARLDIDPATGRRKMFLISTSQGNRFRNGPFQLLYQLTRHGKSRFAFTVHTEQKRRWVFSKTEPQRGVWYHLAGVYDGHHIRLYVNGVQEGMRPQYGALPTDQSTRLSMACMAQSRSQAQPCYRGMLSGKLDEVHIFRTALSPGDILVLRDARHPGVEDATPPEVIIHEADGIANTFEEDGFLLRGTVHDDHDIASMELTLSDASGEVLRQRVDFSAGGHWAVWVDGSLLTAGQPLHVSLEVIDGAGNRRHLTQTVSVAPTDNRARQLVNRLTFGATVSLLNTVNQLGADAYLQQQLQPQSIPADDFDIFIDAFEPVLTKDDLQVYMLMRAMHSPRQLQEVMTAFWDNHFNTDINKHGNVDYEFYENRAFRQHALGRFRDLLAISAKSPAMLIYLDSVANIKGEPNENYARELMELHTMGVDGGYSQRDVEEVAKVFTGWQVRSGAPTFEDAFFFNAAQHDASDKEVLGQTIPGGGVEEGEALLDLLAAHPSTAWFICHKLAVLLVQDLPRDALILGCADVFLAAKDRDDQMAQVVQYFTTSPDFNDPKAYRSKIVTPLEFVVRTVRGLGAVSEGGDLPGELRRLGQRLFEFPVPTGYGETGDDWLNSNQLLERMRFVNRMAFNTPGGNRSTTDPMTFCRAYGYETSEAIVSFWFRLMFGTNPSTLERRTALDVLTDQGTQTFDIAAADADTKLRRLVGTVLSFPGYHYQ
ncbi:MAG: hypothetical protein ETSY1_29175 [Candidatus Entotheonella factor]|uniref:LamG-like jellyroll fold domain-containing protein n=1 Tax=Entotheonella factor TaxID=1429438 RepID=W4LDP2_ENTF1|nr:MAG: hypothetical protein ETSY1_29175 [Candidatus Entotheonella factor]